MARYRLNTNAKEKSTYKINVSFFDDNNDPITPVTLTWTLTDRKGYVINSRSDVSVTDPTSSEDILLYGNDLEILQQNNRLRIFTISATWSGTEPDLPLRDECEFEIDNLQGVS